MEQSNQGSRACVACGGQVAWGTNICPYCGKDYGQTQSAVPPVMQQPIMMPQTVMMPPPEMAAASKGSTVGAIVGMIGGLLFILGIFIPWANGSIAGESIVSYSGWDLYNMGATEMNNTFGIVLVLLGLGILSMLLAILIALRARAAGAIVTVFGVISLIFGILLLSAISAYVVGLLSESGITMGLGLYVCVIGSIVIIIGGLIGVAHKNRAPVLLMPVQQYR